MTFVLCSPISVLVILQTSHKPTFRVTSLIDVGHPSNTVLGQFTRPKRQERAFTRIPTVHSNNRATACSCSVQMVSLLLKRSIFALCLCCQCYRECLACRLQRHACNTQEASRHNPSMLKLNIVIAVSNTYQKPLASNKRRPCATSEVKGVLVLVSRIDRQHVC